MKKKSIVKVCFCFCLLNCLLLSNVFAASYKCGIFIAKGRDISSLKKEFKGDVSFVDIDDSFKKMKVEYNKMFIYYQYSVLIKSFLEADHRIKGSRIFLTRRGRKYICNVGPLKRMLIWQYSKKNVLKKDKKSIKEIVFTIEENFYPFFLEGIIKYIFLDLKNPGFTIKTQEGNAIHFSCYRLKKEGEYLYIFKPSVFYSGHLPVIQFFFKYYSVDTSGCVKSCHFNICSLSCAFCEMNYNRNNPYNFTIEGNFKNSINDMLIVMLKKRGIKSGIDVNLTPAFLTYLVEKTKYLDVFNAEIRSKKRNFVRNVIQMAYRVNYVLMQGDITTLTKLLDNFVVNYLRR